MGYHSPFAKAINYASSLTYLFIAKRFKVVF
jgi:hypothetical protein